MRAIYNFFRNYWRLMTGKPLVGFGPRDYECQDCIGMKAHGCYCQAVGAIASGGPLPLDGKAQP